MSKVYDSDMEQKVNKILSECDEETADAIYRRLWFYHVCEDINSYEVNMELEDPLTDEQMERAAELYVYEGKYDCNLSYWDNIENVILLTLESYNK